MTQFPEFRFQGFVLRAAADADLALAAMWTAADLDHMHIDPRFWLLNNQFSNSFLLEDAVGAVFFFRIDHMSGPTDYERVRVCNGVETRTRVKRERYVTVHIQFAPNDQHGRRLRTMQGMAIGFDWLKKILGQNGFDAVYFTSKNQRLISFAMQRLEFIQDSVVDGETRLKAYLVREPET